MRILNFLPPLLVAGASAAAFAVAPLAEAAPTCTSSGTASLCQSAGNAQVTATPPPSTTRLSTRSSGTSCSSTTAATAETRGAARLFVVDWDDHGQGRPTPGRTGDAQSAGHGSTRSLSPIRPEPAPATAPPIPSSTMLR